MKQISWVICAIAFVIGMLPVSQSFAVVAAETHFLPSREMDQGTVAQILEDVNQILGEHHQDTSFIRYSYRQKVDDVRQGISTWSSHDQQDKTKIALLEEAFSILFDRSEVLAHELIQLSSAERHCARNKVVIANKYVENTIKSLLLYTLHEFSNFEFLLEGPLKAFTGTSFSTEFKDRKEHDVRRMIEIDLFQKRMAVLISGANGEKWFNGHGVTSSPEVTAEESIELMLKGSKQVEEIARSFNVRNQDGLLQFQPETSLSEKLWIELLNMGVQNQQLNILTHGLPLTGEYKLIPVGTYVDLPTLSSFGVSFVTRLRNEVYTIVPIVVIFRSNCVHRGVLSVDHCEKIQYELRPFKFVEIPSMKEDLSSFLD